MDFEWSRLTRDSQRSGTFPHVSVEDRIFVETVGGNLTIKVEDNTDSGEGVYSEPVEYADQTLDDAEMFYARKGPLIFLKIASYPIYLILMTIFSSILMLNIKKYKSNTFKISIGLFLCVIIYYFNNLFNVLGVTEKINFMLSVWMPLAFLTLVVTIMTLRINEK